MGAVKSRADKTTPSVMETEGMQRVTLTPARMTDVTVDPKLANEARKRAKSQDVERSSNSPTSFVRGSVRRMKKRKLFSAASATRQSDSTTRSGKEIDRKLRVFIPDLSNPTTKCVFHVYSVFESFEDNAAQE